MGAPERSILPPLSDRFTGTGVSKMHSLKILLVSPFCRPASPSSRVSPTVVQLEACPCRKCKLEHIDDAVHRLRFFLTSPEGGLTGDRDRMAPERLLAMTITPYRTTQDEWRTRDLPLQMNSANALLGAPRIRGALLTLGIKLRDRRPKAPTLPLSAPLLDGRC